MQTIAKKARLGWLCCAGAIAGCGGGGGGGGGGGEAEEAQRHLQAEIASCSVHTNSRSMSRSSAAGRTPAHVLLRLQPGPDLQRLLHDRHLPGRDVFGHLHLHGGAITCCSDNPVIRARRDHHAPIVATWGCRARFETPNMRCGALGHGYNDAATDTFNSYGCPIINIQAVSYEENAIEFVHRSFRTRFRCVARSFASATSGQQHPNAHHPARLRDLSPCRQPLRRLRQPSSTTPTC